MSNLINFINKIKNNKYNIINSSFIKVINECIDIFLPKLNNIDKDIIKILTLFIIDQISYKYNFEKTEHYYYQWKQNNFRDTKGVILLLLPFIDDKEKSDGYLLDKLTDLNQLLYTYKENHISNKILLLDRSETLNKYFKFGNMSIGLLNYNKDNDNLLNLYENNEKLIYKIMYNNLLGLLYTLEIMNGKYYINWINIVPINIKDYIQSNIYIETNKIMDAKDINKIINNSYLINYSGLWCGDIYNLIRIKFYEEIKKFKWLIFPYEISKTNNIYLIHGLHKMLNIENILNNDIYENLFIDQQNNFKTNIQIMIFNLKNNISILNLFRIDIEIIKYYLIYVINNNKNIENNRIIRKFKLNIENEYYNDDFDKEDIKTFDNIKLVDIILCLEYFLFYNIDILWDFLKVQLENFRMTAYSKYLIYKHDNKYKLNMNYKFKLLNKDSNLDLNLKNLYNISKSLSHISIDNWILMDSNYMSLNIVNRQIFFNKIFGLININQWINLKNNLKKQKIIYEENNYNEYINTIINNFREICLDLVFEELIISGILNQFKLNREITDKSLLPLNTKKKQNKIKKLLENNFNDNKHWLESYYYLNNDTFGNLPKIRFDKDKDKYDKYNYNNYDEYTYFDLICKDQSWLLFYAMDWISQISFFQHYIFHQILYVTGATGQGKSTQVPKLFMYALKVIDYKSNGKVICTAPRIQPLLDNSKRIAEELGVPIDMLSNTSNVKIKTDNFYLQYKYKEDYHTKSVNHGSIKIVTDGTLLEEINQNPTMFEKTDNIFNNKIKYDIIFIDEAHEHGTNMDIIITLMRQTCYYNNKVRLIIVSATMDDDEPIYRRYFRDNNDKLLFPIKDYFFDPILNQKILLNLEYMDRRYHISPPGETSQYKVEEIYLDTNIELETEKKSADEVQNKGYEKIINICNTTLTGQILFFANGKEEILNAVKYLNQNTPSTCIALPFFSELNQNYKNIISKINTKISNIKTKKENVFTDWGNTYIEDNSVSSNIYKRAIIIATNVAEASVTIPDLFYVVDNGYAKVKKFIPELNLEKLEIQKISEASRIQRKGRVGRIGDGYVYFMYAKNARFNIKPKYKITQENISELLVSLLNDKNFNDIKIDDTINYSNLIISNICDPNIYEEKSSTNITNIYTYISGLKSLYDINYSINGTHLDRLYYNDDIYNIEHNKFIYRYNSGQIIYNLLDQYGNFYLIHPYENSIQRNILNNIIAYNNIKTEIIKLYEYRYMLSYLYNKKLLNDNNFDYLLKINNDNKKMNIKSIKTPLANDIIKLKSELDLLDIDDSISMIVASTLNCENEILEIIILLKTLGNSLSNITNNNWINFKELYKYKKYNSDIIFLYDVIKNLKINFSNLLIFNIDKFYEQIDDHIQQIFNNFKKYIKSGKNIIDPPNINYNTNLWNKLISIKNNTNNINVLNDEYIKIIINNDIEIINILKNNIKTNTDAINKWAINNYFKSEVIIQYLENLSIKYLYIRLKNNEILKKNKLNMITKLNNNLITIQDKIIGSFLYSRYFQFNYLSKNKTITKINNYNTYNISLNKNNINTIINLYDDYIFYLKYQDILNDENTISISYLSKINLKWIVLLLPEYINPIFNLDIDIRFKKEFLDNCNFKGDIDLIF
jgi:hypothetical protein